VTNRLALFGERDAVLVVVAAIGDQRPHFNERFGQLQVARLSGCAIQIDHGHVM
jgi:hypothetical protein